MQRSEGRKKKKREGGDGKDGYTLREKELKEKEGGRRMGGLLESRLKEVKGRKRTERITGRRRRAGRKKHRKQCVQ